MRVPNKPCVPFSTRDTNRSFGKALLPRLEDGLPKASPLHFSSAVSSVLPSTLTKRQHLYQAPFVDSVAIGCTISSCSCLTGSHPSRVRACEIPDLPVTLTVTDGSCSHCNPSRRHRRNSR